METVRLSDRPGAAVDDGVTLTELALGDRCNVLHFRIDPGVEFPEHRHEHEQLGYILAGELTFVLADEEVTVGPNDSYAIGANEAHAAENRGDVPVTGIDIFSPPRTNPDWESWYREQREG
jgi:quercetin dioxygenase-like cupin family protein